MAQETTPTQAPTEVIEIVVTEEPVPVIPVEIVETAENNLTALAIAALVLVIMAICIVLTFAVVQIGRSVPASLAGIYFNAAYAGQQFLKTKVDELADAAAKSTESWDDEVVKIAAKYTDEQLRQLVEVARERGVIIGDDTPQG